MVNCPIPKARPIGRRLQPSPSIFHGEALPDFIDPSVQRIEPCVERLVVKIKNIPAGQQPENPVVALDVVEDLLDRVADGNNNSQQDIHRILRLEKNDTVILKDFAAAAPSKISR
jgi:hypothetical protein